MGQDRGRLDFRRILVFHFPPHRGVSSVEIFENTPLEQFPFIRSVHDWLQLRLREAPGFEQSIEAAPARRRV
jgi:hypothetical protein